jgi:hypothetical protein
MVGEQIVGSSVIRNREMTLRFLLACVSLGFASSIASPQPVFGQDLPETKSSEYPSVAAALVALRARTDLEVEERDGWLGFFDVKHNVIWTFAPKYHPAYPAMVKRAIVEDAKGVYVDMSAQCEASKLACDALVREFQAMNASLGKQMQKAGAPGN